MSLASYLLLRSAFALRRELPVGKNPNTTYLEGDEGLDGPALDGDAGGHDLDDAAVKDLVALGQARNRHELHLENDVATGVLDHAVINLETLLVLVTANCKSEFGAIIKLGITYMRRMM